MFRFPRSVSRGAARLAAALVLVAATAAAAQAQMGYYAAIAYSQSTGKIGYTARQARTREAAEQLAMRMCAAQDAKVYMWGRDQWVAIATVDGHVGTAGFGRGASPDEAQQRALAECGKRARGHAYRVVLCFHSMGRRTTSLRSVAATTPAATSRTGFFAALAFSPTTGAIGSTSGEEKTLEAAKALAIRRCNAADARVFMWGDQWIAAAVADGAKGVAGFGPGATREEAEKMALAQCAKYAKGRPCRVAVVLFSGAKNEPAESAAIQAAAEQPAAGATPANQLTPTPAESASEPTRAGD